MESLFVCITVFTCEISNSGIHGDLIMGNCGPGNYSEIGRGGSGVMEL